MKMFVSTVMRPQPESQKIQADKEQCPTGTVDNRYQGDAATLDITNYTSAT